MTSRTPSSRGPRTPADVRIGISGWRYPPWRGVFYPPGLVQKKELHFASRQLRSVEINGSSYSLQRRRAYVATMSKAARHGKIFVDHFRNGRGATATLPYSPRARAPARPWRYRWRGRTSRTSTRWTPRCSRCRICSRSAAPNPSADLLVTKETIPRKLIRAAKKKK